MKKPDHYAVFGHPIAHSLSPLIHTWFAEQTGEALHYSRQDVPPECFETAVGAFRAGGGQGLNCTVPLKELAFRLADALSPRAQLSHAVNTLVFRKDSVIFGDNTDGVGLLRDLTENLGLTLANKNILVLGAGGAARGILGPLLEQNPKLVIIANRTEERAVMLAEQFASFGNIQACGFAQLQNRPFDLIVNATAAGLHGQLPPLPNGLIAPGGVCYDLMYGEKALPFLEWGRIQGAGIAVDGLGMLVEQAAEAFWLWRGVRPSTESVITRLRDRA